LNTSLWLVLLLLLLLVAAPAAAQENCRSLTRLDAQALQDYQFESDEAETDETAWTPLAEDERYRLGSINVVRQEVFETERNWLHRAANRLHVRTRENVVLSVLPMRSGDTVDARMLEEAERILRNRQYHYDARVIPKRLCGDVLDVYVVVRDVWTLEPRLSLQRSGGENDVGLGLGDSNVAGSGKAVALGFDRDEERRGWSLFVSDPNIRDSRWAAEALVVDNNDGERVAGTLARPFFGLDTRWALALSGDHFSRRDNLFFQGQEVWEYDAETRFVRASAGWSGGLSNRFVNRLLVGYALEDYQFDLLPGFVAAFPDSSLPDRRFGYPFVAFQSIEDRFDKRVNLDRVQRTEDIPLGRQMRAELGYSSPLTGGDGKFLVGRASFSDGSWLSPDELLALEASLSGYYDVDGGRSENLRADLAVSYRRQHAPRWSLLARAVASMAHRQTLDQQLLLGGEFGLRGYPNRYQVGDRRFLVTLEERFYSNIYPLQMFRLGGAVFLDAGRAWYAGAAPDWLPDDRSGPGFGLLANAGFGLRLESTRTRGDRILHLDVAFPLRDGPEVRGVEVTLVAKQTL
jgi:hypothetical protein